MWNKGCMEGFPWGPSNHDIVIGHRRRVSRFGERRYPQRPGRAVVGTSAEWAARQPKPQRLKESAMAYVMVDVEADGPIPGDYSMVSFGAVLVREGLDITFYGRLRPVSEAWVPEALAVSGF